ncbi:MAG: MerR family transcriptional regulator [Roseibium sp.]|uniref:MerR family transcriptional regulator n=1 Tax=Roseibium sp. TaxID=1936156 RepID=UPI001B10349C|nr:MerR family transcriptional regulator [Roseibium sp.]MBO6892804.1 MerR family transcriptional regulator [Roseibium sp.]MBO6928477.1 MerR family transcriptional regulator [Roseibium sp.]
MQAKDAAKRLGITQRMLRHYENAGLMDVHRSENGYRIYSETDIRRAGRIRDFIATGFSTREIRAMAACLSDEGAGPCEGGIEKMMEKLEHIDRLQADLDARRDAVLARIAELKEALAETLEDKTALLSAHSIDLPQQRPEASNRGVLDELQA